MPESFGVKKIKEFFDPESIAVIGASRNPYSAGHGILKSLINGGVFDHPTNHPFMGRIYPVNPNASEILGLRCYNSILDIPESVELAVIALKSELCLPVIKECSKKGVKGVIIISAGFSELGETGKEMQEKIVDIARSSGIRIIGPNCLGLIRPSKNLNVSFGPCMPNPGNVAFFSQSGALVDSVIDWSLEVGYGFSCIVSFGNQADLDVSDFIEWAANDKSTKAIAFYIEGIRDGKKFMRLAKKACVKKPLIALKAGKTSEGSKAISSHTGSLAGEYEVYRAAFKQCGIAVADNVEEFFDLAKTLAEQPVCRKNSIAIVTNGGGAGVLCADHCSTHNVKLAKLSNATIETLDKSNLMHPAYSRRNPLDLVGDALPERYEIAINTLLNQADIYGLIVIQTLQTMTSSILDAKAVINARRKFPDKPILCSYMGGKFSREGIKLLQMHGVPDFNVPYKTAIAMRALIERGEWLKKGTD